GNETVKDNFVFGGEYRYLLRITVGGENLVVKDNQSTGINTVRMQFPTSSGVSFKEVANSFLWDTLNGSYNIGATQLPSVGLNIFKVGDFVKRINPSNNTG